MSTSDRGEVQTSDWSQYYSGFTMLGLGLLVGLLAGWSDVAFREFEDIRFGSLTRYPTYFIAVAAVGNLIISMAVTLGLVAASCLLRFLRRPRIALPILLLPLFLSITFNALPRVASYASFILALGLATTQARIIFYLFKRSPMMRLAAFASAFVAALAVVGASFSVYQSTNPALSARTPAADSTNVIVITLDTLRAANMSLYGYERPTTPNLDDLAQASLVFDRAYATTSWTLPSHASMFTGLDAQATGTDWDRPLSAEPLVLAEVFRNRGYDSSGFIANLVYCSARSGLARGIRHYEDHRFVLRMLLDCTAFGRFLDGKFHRLAGQDVMPYPGRKNAEDLNEDFFGWLDSRDNDRPFFTFLNYFDVHQPYVTPEPFHSRYDRLVLKDDDRQVMQLAAKGDPAQLDLMDQYDGAIAYLDQQLGELLKGLKTRGLDKNCLIVITSDHGETFAEHPASGHATTLYPETIHVPLMFYWPGHLEGGRRLETEVTLRDLPQTILNLLAFEEASRFPGSPMPMSADLPPSATAITGYLSQGIRVDQTMPNYAGSLRTLIESGYQLIVHEDPKLGDEFYHLSVDPFARDNLIAEPALQERIKALKSKLKALGEKAN